MDRGGGGRDGEFLILKPGDTYRTHKALEGSTQAQYFPILLALQSDESISCLFCR